MTKLKSKKPRKSRPRPYKPRLVFDFQPVKKAGGLTAYEYKGLKKA